MDKLYHESLLFDFYGELLTQRQRELYEEAVLQDYSPTELAADYGISRQAVHDLVRRAGASLEGYESRLHLVERFLALKEKVAEIESLTDDERILKLAHEILEEL